MAEVITSKQGILVLSGYGLRVAVERGHLVVADGIGRERRCGTFSRATSKLKRLVILGHSGTISFEALRWLTDLGASFIQIDADGNVITASTAPGLDDARLRRAQALAAFTDTGMEIVRELLHTKLEKQAGVLERMPQADQAIRQIHRAAGQLAHAETVEDLRLIESGAAAAYWGTWAEFPVRFVQRDQPRVPEHWRVFGTRSSPLSHSPRKAANPANALLNYLYAILEAETRIALLTVGLDPGMGLLHADLRARDSLACDVMEALRPDVDAVVLDLLSSRRFRASDFFESRQGVCRVMQSITQRLAEMSLTWAKLVAPLAERLAQQFVDARLLEVNSRGDAIVARSSRITRETSTRLATPLTQENRSAGRDKVRRKTKRDTRAPSVALAPHCERCGSSLENEDRLLCDECLRLSREEHQANWVEKGRQVLAERRAAGDDPSHGGEVGRKRGASNAKRARERVEWEREHGDGSVESERFVREIQPKLAVIPLSAIVEATGFSLRYASLIRRGEYVPHPVHFNNLLRLVEPDSSDDEEVRETIPERKRRLH